MSSGQYWEDRLCENNPDAYKRVTRAMTQHAKGLLTGGDFYDLLTSNGLTSEEAGAIIQVESEA